MRIQTLALLGALTALTSLTATSGCRGDDDDDGADNNDTPVDGTPSDGKLPTDGTNQGTVTVKQVQGDTIASGDAIELKGVVVTAIDKYGAKTGDLWVEDVGGGEFSGVKVFGAPIETVAVLEVGDIVNITSAEKYEFACTGTICGTGMFDPGQSITEVQGLTAGSLMVTKTGHGEVPAPAPVDAIAISMMPKAMQDIEWEKWEGVLIKVTNVQQVGDTGMFGAGADDQKKFELPGKLVVESVLTGFPTTAAADFCYSQIIGIGDYFFDHLLLPRTAADFGGTGTGCPVRQTVTIPAIQAGTATGPVKVSGVFVTAVSAGRTSYWVSQSLTAAPNQGIQVFATAALPATIVVGATVDVQGTVKEFNSGGGTETLTQLVNPITTTFVAAPTTAPIPVTGVMAAALAAEQYESTLVTLTNVKVVTIGDPTPMTGNFGVGSLKQGTTTFLSDDDIFLLPAAEAGKCYASITGIWTYQVFNDAYGLLPLAVGTGTGTCP